MDTKELSDPQEKALQINLDPSIYGAFAEIGAGQETANWFFRTSGAAGTVAKTISAYDMTVSDTLYGSVRRYVSEARLRQMLDYEFTQLINRLGEKRGENTRFFAFCNTAKIKGYRDNGPWNAWLGIRFQLQPGSPHSDLIVHVRLKEPNHASQMRDLGAIGVNLIYAVFYKMDQMQSFIESLADDIPPGHLEIDVVRFEGHGFEMVDNRLFALQLVQSGLSDSTLFQPDGSVAQAADVLYKRPIVLMRGSFRPLCNIHLEMMDSVRSKFRASLNETQQERGVDICEISMSNLLRGDEVDHLDFLDRVDSLAALGKTVLVTNMTHFHRISALLNQYTNEPVAIALSIGLLNELFKDKWVEDLPGGILSSIGRTFLNKTKLYVTPWINRRTGEFVTAKTFMAPAKYKYLYQHLIENGLIVEVPYFNQKYLLQTPRDIQKMIESNDPSWEEYVPPEAHRAARNLVSPHLKDAFSPTK
ncbi:MAG: TonB-dependent receptor [Akkermansiaceae bacterium]|nr:TonB-dependent receptor [Akkermansia sp.]MCD7799148.1 TonB-dependent receptor [Akkermansiaceae bacterium]MCD8071033.1 TonB-dependent receptor [Akkermansiaceae bacterium]